MAQRVGIQFLDVSQSEQAALSRYVFRLMRQRLVDYRHVRGELADQERVQHERREVHRVPIDQRQDLIALVQAIEEVEALTTSEDDAIAFVDAADVTATTQTLSALEVVELTSEGCTVVCRERQLDQMQHVRVLLIAEEQLNLELSARVVHRYA